MVRTLAFPAVYAALLAGGAVALADCPANRTFVVTNVYDIDGEAVPELSLTVGYTYTFDLHNPSGHPFMLTFDPNGGGGTSPLPLSAGVGCVCQGCGTCTRHTLVFTPAASLAGQTVYYECTVHAAMGNAIHILPAPSITVNTLPQPVERCAGGNAQFTVSATSNETQTLDYQWLRNGVPVANAPGHIAGATSASLTLSGVTSEDAGGYSCTITGPCKNMVTGAAALTVNACCPADVGMQSGLPGADGRLDNNDFVVFIDWFFNADTRADRGSQGGSAGADGTLDNNDFVVFIDQFFASC
jgi:hypothetical protein